MSCLNFMNFNAIRDQVGTSDVDDNIYDLSDTNLMKNCLTCNMRPELPKELAIIAEFTVDPIVTQLEKTGMKRKCYKDE